MPSSIVAMLSGLSAYRNFPILSRTLLALSAAALPAAYAETLLLRPAVPERYIVQPGDTISSISGMYLQEPKRWPELWRMDLQQAVNPQLIRPGDQVVLQRSDPPYLNIVHRAPTAQSAPQAIATQAMPANASNNMAGQTVYVQSNPQPAVVQQPVSQPVAQYYATVIAQPQPQPYTTQMYAQQSSDTSPGRVVIYRRAQPAAYSGGVSPVVYYNAQPTSLQQPAPQPIVLRQPQSSYMTESYMVHSAQPAQRTPIPIGADPMQYSIRRDVARQQNGYQQNGYAPAQPASDSQLSTQDMSQYIAPDEGAQ